MAVTGTLSDRYKYELAKAGIDLATDSLKIILMRNGFTFDKRIHGLYANVMGSIIRSDISFVSSGKHILTSGGSFITAGFVVGGKITVSGSASNNTTFTVVTVAATDMTVSESVTDEGAGATDTIVGADELATLYGYVRNTKVLTTPVLTEDNTTNDRAELTCDDPVWTASGGSIGPTPGAMIFDDTVTEKTVIGYLDFGGNQTAASGSTFTISAIKVRTS